MRGLFFIILLFSFSFNVFAQEKAVEFSASDREKIQKIDDIDKRLIKLETKVEEGFKNIDSRFQNLDSRLESIQNNQQTNFQVVIGLIIALIAFIFWDRRRSL